MAVANAPVPVMANTNIKVPVDLKLQIRGHTGNLISISDVLNDFFMYKIEKKILVYEFFFKHNNYFFSTGTPTTNKLDDGVPVTHF